MTGERDRQAAELRVMESSHSWRMTAPFRSLRRAMQRRQPLLLTFRQAGLGMYRALPMSVPTRLKIKGALFRTFPFLFRRTSTYRAWEAYRRTIERLQVPLSMAPVVRVHGDGSLPAWFYADAENEYVPIAQSAAIETRIKAIAFYLPQFHPIPENDRWWGKGFTEWTNVSRGKPQFAGHYQPHLPGELGFYDLRIPDVQRRQIELAKMYGLYGFCYHFYWFGGKRLLRHPLDQLMANPDMDFPFCLCWANESWTRRWDGQEGEILIGQQHSPEDDLAFIQEIAPMLRDPRYIRVGGRPVLVVYRPAVLPDASTTAAHWRSYCRENGIGDLYLISTHAFDRIDPRQLGFDAAMEFAPNNLGSPAAPRERHRTQPGVPGHHLRLPVSGRTQPHLSGASVFGPVPQRYADVGQRSSSARPRQCLRALVAGSLSGDARERVRLYRAAVRTRAAVRVHQRVERMGGRGASRAGPALRLRLSTGDRRRASALPGRTHRTPIVVVSHDAHFHGAQRWL